MPNKTVFDPIPQYLLSQLRVIKKIGPGRRGAKRLTDEFGRQLVCIRHRIDPTGTRRLTTVELLVDERPIHAKPSPMVAVKIDLQDRESRRRLKSAGASWDSTHMVWRLRRATAVAIGLKGKIVPPNPNRSAPGK